MDEFNNYTKILGEIITEFSANQVENKESSLELVYKVSRLTMDLREERDYLFDSFMEDMFGGNLDVDIRPLDQRFRKFEYEHVAKMFTIVFDPDNCRTFIQGLIDLCREYKDEIKQLKSAKYAYIRPYVIGRPGKVAGPRRHYSSVEELIKTVRTKEVNVHEDILEEVNNDCYKGDLKKGIIALACLADRYKNEMRDTANICIKYLNENADDITSEEKERLAMYERFNEKERPPEDVLAEEIWANGVGAKKCTKKVLEDLAKVCNRCKSTADDMALMYSGKRDSRDIDRISTIFKDEK